MATAATRSQTRRTSRRDALVDAALAVFLEKGVASTAVDDIVEKAGVAKGTFYLYFRTKDDAVNAVAERIVEAVAGLVEAAASAPGLSPVERLLTLGGSVGEVGSQPHERELIEVFHRPENRAVHDRLSERIVGRLLSTVEAIVRDGIEADQFARQDARLAAAFVLSTFNALHDLVGDELDIRQATAELNAFVLRGLGYRGGPIDG